MSYGVVVEVSQRRVFWCGGWDDVDVAVNGKGEQAWVGV